MHRTDKLTLALDPAADAALSARVRAMGDESHAAADWTDVRSRARRVTVRPGGRRRLVYVGVALAVATVTVAPALALQGRIVDFFQGGPAPAPVEQAFGSLDVGAPPAMGPHVLPGQARAVRSFDLVGGATTTLWVAPTRNGGFCHMFAGALGGCRSAAENSAQSNYVIGFGMTAPRGRVPFVIGGDVNGNVGIAGLELRFEDGNRVALPLTWVSAPIDAGFYLYPVPSSNWDAGHRPALLVATDASGKEIARQELPVVFRKPR